VEKARTELRPDGIPVRTIPPARTPEEIERERQLERLRAQQRALVERRAAEDRVLLRTFRSEEDLIAARDRQIEAVDVMIRITKSHVARQQQRLAELRAEAADLERAGEQAGEHLRAQLAQTEESLNRALGTILQREQQKQGIRAAFAKDLERFRELTAAEQSTPQSEPVEPPVPLQNLVECTGRTECDRLWQQAMHYLKSHSSLPMTMVGADVAMTEAPASDRDTALTLTRLWHDDGSGAWIFLDLQCRDRPAGANDCRNGPRLEVLRGFRDALKPPTADPIDHRADPAPGGSH
jgi:hypothetical protein